MSFSVIYDASVLYPAPLRDSLMWLGLSGIFQARWSEIILNETFASIAKNRSDVDPDKLDRTRKLMNKAIPGALVEDYESRIEGLTLPDVDDRHVLAAALEAEAKYIVTWNLKDFPKEILNPLKIEAISPDVFTLELLKDARSSVLNALKKQQQNLTNPPTDMNRLLDILDNNGLKAFVREVRPLLVDNKE